MTKFILLLLMMTSLTSADQRSLSQHAQVIGEIKSRAAKTEDQKLPTIGQVTASMV